MPADLHSLLLNRAMSAQGPDLYSGPYPAGAPSAPPSPSAKVPPKVDRWATGQNMMDAYRNGWSPNPMMIRILASRY